MGGCVIGVDAGGTMTKAALFDLEGHELACARSRNVTSFPHAGWTERDPDAMWRAAAEAIREVVERSGTDPGDVLAIGVSGYGSGLYLLDDAGDPVRPGIVSPDVRTAVMLEGWARDGRAAKVAPMIQQFPWPGMSLPLMAWLQEHEPEVVERAAQVSFCKDFLRQRLCGDRSTDYTDAGSAGLLDVRSGTYSEAALALFGMEAWLGKLPAIGAADEVVGGVSEAAAALVGLRAGTPVVRGAVDMAASAMASHVTRAEHMSVVAGTFSIAATLHSDAPKLDTIPMLQFAYPLGGFLSVNASATSASNLEWVVKTMLQHGGTPPAGADVYEVVNAAVGRATGRHTDAMFYPYLFGGPAGAPAGLVGMGASTSFDEVMAAVFEGIVFAHKADVDRALSGPDAARPTTIRLTGGASQSEVWSGMFADILGLPVEVPAGSEFGALGTAMCAAAGAGAYGSLAEAVDAMSGIARRHEVDAARGAVHLAKYPRYCAVRDAMAGAMLETAAPPAAARRAEPAHA